MWPRNKKKKQSRRFDGEEDGRHGQLLNVNARLVEQKRARTHRLGAIVLLVTVLIAVLVLAGYALQKCDETLFSQNPRYTLRTLAIHSDGENITPDLVKEWTGLRTGTNLFALDIGKLREFLMANAPMVKSVDIARRLPDTLEVRLSERMPIARMEHKGHGYLGVDREGCLFGLRSSGQTLPVITGYRGGVLQPGSSVRGAVTRALEFLDVCNRTPVGKGLNLATLDVSNDDALLLALGGGECVRLAWPGYGQVDFSRQEIERKLQTLTQILQKASERGKHIAWIDLTYNDDYIPAQEY